MGNTATRKPPIDPLNPPDTKYEFVSREEWEAEPPKSSKEIEDYPLQAALFTATSTRTCKNKADCMKVMKEIQKADMEKGMPDIQHSFYIGGDGNLYEGRGWEAQRAQLDEHDFKMDNTISIAFIGKWKMIRQDRPKRKMRLVAYQLIANGVKRKLLVDHCLYNTVHIKFI